MLLELLLLLQLPLLLLVVPLLQGDSDCESGPTAATGGSDCGIDWSTELAHDWGPRLQVHG